MTDPLSFHPLADIFPLMEGEAYAALVADIKARGLLYPIVACHGKVLDGRNRWRACIEADVPIRIETYSGDDPLGYVLAANLRRRQLNESQLAMGAARLATRGRGGDPNASREALAQDEAADRFGVGRSSVQRARIVLENAEPEIIQAVDQGLLPVKVAAAIAKETRDRQLSRLARDRLKLEGASRQPDDFYRTPEASTRALLAVEKFPSVVWEPACGDGAISRVLDAAGYNVISTDLVDRGYGAHGCDFLQQSTLLAPALITNPPFKLDDEFAIHALDLGAEKVALLARLVWLEGRARLDTLWRREKLARVWAFAERQTLWRGDDAAAETDGGMTAYAWFIFELDHSGPWVGGWL